MLYLVLPLLCVFVITPFTPCSCQAVLNYVGEIGKVRKPDEMEFRKVYKENKVKMDRKDGCPSFCPRDCNDILESGATDSGIYKVYVGSQNRSLHVFCDMETAGGGWLVFQRRKDGAVNFDRNWAEYEKGFGKWVSHKRPEFWLGLTNIHQLLQSKYYRLRVDMSTLDGKTGYAEYVYFSVGCAEQQYLLSFQGFDGGTAGDSLSGGYEDNKLNGMRFSTHDVDNDRAPYNCAAQWRSAWWFNFCAASNLNGVYNWTEGNGTNVRWFSFDSYRPLKTVEMKFRPM